MSYQNNVLPVATEDNSRRLVDRGTQVYTDVITLSDSAWTAINWAADIKEYSVFVRSGTCLVRGNAPGAVAMLDAAAVADNGDGTITIAATAHGFADGDEITIPEAVWPALAGTYTLEAASDANNLVITATYAAKTFEATDYVFGYRDAQYPTGADFGDPLVKGNPEYKKSDGTYNGLQVVFKAKSTSGACILDCRYWR